MTTGAGHLDFRQIPDTGRWVARACRAAGFTGALANMVLLAFAVLAYARPGAVQEMLWPIGCVCAGLSAALMVPVALVLGGARIVALGVASMAFATLGWLLLASGLLSPSTGASLLAGAGLGFATWLVFVCRRHTVPPRASLVGRRAGVAALAGTLVVVLGYLVRPVLGGEMSGPWMAVVGVGGIVAALGWLAVPAWTLRLGMWLHTQSELD